MQKTNEQLDRDLLHILLAHQGKAQRIDRWDLVEQVFDVIVPEIERNDGNPLDREIRYAVQRLRKDGHLICDMGDGGGRWMANTEQEFWEFYSYYISPIRTRREIAEALKSAAKKRWPNLEQPSLFEMERI